MLESEGERERGQERASVGSDCERVRGIGETVGGRTKGVVLGTLIPHSFLLISFAWNVSSKSKI